MLVLDKGDDTSTKPARSCSLPMHQSLSDPRLPPEPCSQRLDFYRASAPSQLSEGQRATRSTRVGDPAVVAFDRDQESKAGTTRPVTGLIHTHSAADQAS
jgi:hypothetical protein